MDRVVNLSRGIYCTNCTYLSNQILVKMTSRWLPWGGGWSWAKRLNFWGFRRAQIIHLSNQIIYQIRNLLKWLQGDFPGRMGLGAKHLKFFSVLPPSSVQFMEKNQDFLGFALAPPPLTIQEDNSRWAGVYISANCACTWIFFQFYPPPPSLGILLAGL